MKENRRLPSVKQLLVGPGNNQIRPHWQVNNGHNKRGKSRRKRLQQRPEEGGRPFRNDKSTNKAALTCLFNQIHNQGNRKTKPNILSSPIQQQSIDGATARRHALRIKSWNLSILVRGKTVYGMRTPFAIQLGENLLRSIRSQAAQAQCVS